LLSQRPGFPDGDGRYWAAANHATNSREIARSHPAVDGNIRLVDGCCGSRPDAKRARSAINAYPKDAKDDSADE